MIPPVCVKKWHPSITYQSFFSLSNSSCSIFQAQRVDGKWPSLLNHKYFLFDVREWRFAQLSCCKINICQTNISTTIEDLVYYTLKLKRSTKMGVRLNLQITQSRGRFWREACTEFAVVAVSRNFPLVFTALKHAKKELDYPRSKSGIELNFYNIFPPYLHGFGRQYPGYPLPCYVGWLAIICCEHEL